MRRASSRVPECGTAIAAVVLASSLVAGCGQSHASEDGGPDEVGHDAGVDAGRRVDAGDAGDAASPDTGPVDACVADEEACNALDDDCDGVVDETPAEAACAVPRGTAACVDGACVIAECDTGFEDCNGEPADGCETDIEGEPFSCGACGRSCRDGAGCRDGVCDDERIVQITAGWDHACAVRATGEALCWGGNESGQLGTGDRAERLVATSVAGGRRFETLVAASGFSCGILAGGGVACWGANIFGQLGDGTRVGRLEPVDCVGLPAIVELAPASHANGFVLARTPSGDVWGWGNNYYGQLGVPPPPAPFGDVTPILTPIRGVVSLTASAGYGCAVMDDATLACWGLPSRPAPTGADSIRWRSVEAGQGHACAIDEAGALFCWGRNTSSAVGPFPCTECPSPQRLVFPEPVAQVQAGGSRTCAVLESGAPRCWGSGSPVPSAPPGLGRVEAIALSDFLTCALDVRARVWCWYGWRVGDGTAELRETPVEVLGLYEPPLGM